MLARVLQAIATAQQARSEALGLGLGLILTLTLTLTLHGSHMHSWNAHTVRGNVRPTHISTQVCTTAVHADDLPLLLPLALDPPVRGDLLEAYHQLQLRSSHRW